jgi:hypothetical protein
MILVVDVAIDESSVVVAVLSVISVDEEIFVEKVVVAITNSSVVVAIRAFGNLPIAANEIILCITNDPFFFTP